MKNKELIGSYGSIALITTLIFTKALISAPAFYIAQSASAGWMEVLMSGLIEIFILLMVMKLMSLLGKGDIIDISERIFGRGSRTIVGIISCIVILISTSAVLRTFAELIRSTLNKKMNYEVILLCVVPVAILVGHIGIKALSSLNGLILPLVIISVAIIILINRFGFSFSNLFPFCGPGFDNVLSNAALRNSTFFEIGIILFLRPYLGENIAIKKIGFTALTLSIALITGVTFFYQLTIPYEAANSFATPLYQMSRMIKSGTFFQRIEPINVFIWSGVMYVYIGTGIWLITDILQKAFSLSSSKPTSFVVTLIAVTVALIPGSEASVEKIYDWILTYAYIAYPIAPTIFLSIAFVIYKIRKRRAKV